MNGLALVLKDTYFLVQNVEENKFYINFYLFSRINGIAILHLYVYRQHQGIGLALHSGVVDSPCISCQFMTPLLLLLGIFSKLAMN